LVRSRAISSVSFCKFRQQSAKLLKQRGRRLGRTGAEILAPKFRDEAKARAEQLAPVIRRLQRDGYSMRGIAVELDKRKVPTPRGGAWHPEMVKRALPRLEGDTR
jgi:hypothetical protein